MHDWIRTFNRVKLGLNECFDCDFGHTKVKRGEREGQSWCITRRGLEIMHHLCPYPGGPVKIDPQPLTFSDTQSVSTRSVVCGLLVCRHVWVFVCVRAFWTWVRAWSSPTFPLDYKVQAGYTRRVFLSLFCCHSNQKVRLEYGKLLVLNTQLK